MNLYKLKNLTKYASKGFTLIELLIVIAILGVLAAAVLVAINPAQKINSAKNARVRSDIAAFGAAAMLYGTDTGLGGVCSPGGFPNTWGAAACGNSSQFFTSTAPKDPSPRDYAYLAYKDTGGTTACAPSTGSSPCGAVSVAGTAFIDANSVPVVSDTTSAWCWRSITGTITLLSTQTTVALNEADCKP